MQRDLVKAIRLAAAIMVWMLSWPLWADGLSAPLPGLTFKSPPANAGSFAPNLFVAPDGRVFLTWLEPAERDSHELRFSLFSANRWLTPARIQTGEDWFANWADFPSISAFNDGTLIAHWLVKNADLAYAYDIHITRSRDNGRTWTSPSRLNRDQTPTQHGFLSMVPVGDDMVALWLDGRDGDMSLRHAKISSNGATTESMVLDPRTCSCCQTAAALGDQGLVAAYRDRDHDEVRDLSVLRMTAGGWTAPTVLHPDGWKIPGCPVNGPAMDAMGSTVVAAWFTAAQGSQVKAVFSLDGGREFGAPIVVAGDRPLGRVDVALISGDSAMVSWLEATPTGTAIRVRLVYADRAPGKIFRVAAGAIEGFPRIARRGNMLLFAWTQRGAGPRVHSAIAEISSLADH